MSEQSHAEAAALIASAIEKLTACQREDPCDDHAEALGHLRAAELKMTMRAANKRGELIPETHVEQEFDEATGLPVRHGVPVVVGPSQELAEIMRGNRMRRAHHEEMKLASSARKPPDADAGAS